ncbi:hypothetical protein CPB86DRAFT_871216 [Serendipita vermifera]|nr:hypothetical protein CPB86DRAFT_871216 [Serendipita vermifera]
MAGAAVVSPTGNDTRYSKLISPSEAKMPQNAKLPFDILCMIFKIYAETDGREDPLEKLLLVCKVWTIAASRNHTLWCSFRMTCSSDADLHFWCSRITKRIDHCGDGLLNIKVKLFHFMASKSMVSRIASQLIGERGIMVERWRRFCIEVPQRNLWNVWSPALLYPTPNLSSLRIQDLSCNNPILPFAPLLEELELDDCSVYLSKSLEALRTLKLRLAHLEVVNCTMPSDSLLTLPTLESVFLRLPFRGHFPTGFSAPHLQKLSIHITSDNSLKSFKMVLFTEDFAKSIVKEMKQLAKELTGLRKVRALSKVALRMILLCFQDGLIALTGPHTCILEVGYDTEKAFNSYRDCVTQIFELHSNHAAMDLHHVRQIAHLPIKDTWDDVIHSLIDIW